MRLVLHLTLPELESGASVQMGSRDRITQLAHLSAQGWPIAISPIRTHQGRTVAAVLLTDQAIDQSGKGTATEIRFRPIWCRTYTLCHQGKDEPVAIVLETSSGKFWTDIDGTREMNNITTTGDGCDPNIVKNAETALGDLLSEAGDHPGRVLAEAIKFLKKEF